MSNMYSEVKPWNIFKGCKFDCIYCRPSFQAQAKRQKHNCERCYSFTPHEHQERLEKGPPKASIVWPGSSGDIAFATPEFLHRAVSATRKRPDQTYYWQSKNPKYLSAIINALRPDEKNHIILTTLETNRDAGYDKISKSPQPTDRAYDFMELPWPRKIVTVEPIMDFDFAEFILMIMDIKPEAIWLGYNTRPKQVRFSEPSMDKTLSFISKLQYYGIPVKTKYLPWEGK